MDSAFWHERWLNGQTGFHEPDGNARLRKHFGAFEVEAQTQLQVTDKAEIFVPLCGKSTDMSWLADQGLRVVGVELSEIAVESFFENEGLVPKTSQVGKLRLYQAGPYRVFCGDFFDLQSDYLNETRYTFDRGSFIALPTPMRERYGRHMRTLLPTTCKTLLIALEYDQATMSGPPFSVLEAEVHSTFEDGFGIQLLETQDILDMEARFKAKGLTKLIEKTYLLTRLGQAR